jgi:hypothetical protein
MCPGCKIAAKITPAASMFGDDDWFMLSVLGDTFPILATEITTTAPVPFAFQLWRLERAFSGLLKCVNKRSICDLRWTHVCSFNINYKNKVKFCRSLLNNKWVTVAVILYEIRRPILYIAVERRLWRNPKGQLKFSSYFFSLGLWYLQRSSKRFSSGKSCYNIKINYINRRLMAEKIRDDP